MSKVQRRLCPPNLKPVLFLTLTLYWLVKGLEAPRFSAYAGFALATAVLCRPTNALMGLPIAAYIFWHRRGQLVTLADGLAALVPGFALMAYHLHYFGSPFTTGFAGITASAQLWRDALYLFGTPLDEGLAGVLTSPGRGLCIYSPILLVAVVGVVMVWKNPPSALLKYLSLAPVLNILLTVKWVNWWGGGSYGARLLADMTPSLCLYLYPPFKRARVRPFLQYAFASLAAQSIGLHAAPISCAG